MKILSHVAMTGAALAYCLSPIPLLYLSDAVSGTGFMQPHQCAAPGLYMPLPPELNGSPYLRRCPAIRCGEPVVAVWRCREDK